MIVRHIHTRKQFLLSISFLFLYLPPMIAQTSDSSTTQFRVPTQSDLLTFKKALLENFQLDTLTKTKSRKSCNCGCKITRESYTGPKRAIFSIDDFCDSYVFTGSLNYLDLNIEQKIKDILNDCEILLLNKPHVKEKNTPKIISYSIEGESDLTFMTIKFLKKERTIIKISLPYLQ